MVYYRNHFVNTDESTLKLSNRQQMYLYYPRIISRMRLDELVYLILMLQANRLIGDESLRQRLLFTEDGNPVTSDERKLPLAREREIHVHLVHP